VVATAVVAMAIQNAMQREPQKKKKYIES